MAAPDAAAILKCRCEAFARSNKVLSRDANGAQTGVDLSLFMAIRYDQLANQFDERYHHQSFLGIQDWLRRLVSSPRASRILEVGSGTGHWLNILNDLPIELIGIDPSGAMLEKARARATRAGLLCACAESIPFQARSFDLIFCINFITSPIP